MANTFEWNDTFIATFPDAEFGYANDNAWSMNSSTDAFGCGFQVPEAMSLTHGNVYCAGKTGTSPFYKLQVWPMSATSNTTPDTSGTVLAETADFQATYSFPGVLLKEAFLTPYSATAGEILCVIAVYADDGSTIDGSNFAQFLYTKGRQGQMTGLPSVLLRTTGAWYANSEVFYPSGPYITTDKTYDIGGTPCALATALVIGGDGDLGALKMTLPAAIDGVGINLFCKGIKYAGFGPAGDDVFRCGIWNSSGVALIRSPEMLGKKGGGSTPGAFGHYLSMTDMLFGDVLELTSGNTYYLGVERVSGSFNMSTHRFDGNNDMFRAWPGGENFKGSYWDASDGSPAWDDEFGSSFGEGRTFISPLLSDIQGTSAGGGGSTTGATMGVIG